jgi:uncharacterized protein
MKTARGVLFLILIAVLLSPLPAATREAAGPGGLYSGRVRVADQGEAARAEGFRAALGQVLVKLSGQRQVVADPRLAPLQDSAAELVEEYRYLAPEPLPGAPAAADPAPGSLLVVEFSAPALDAELRRLEVPRWPAERGPLLLWILAPDGERSGLAESARERLAERGVPVLEPLWDLQDTLALGAAGAGSAAARIAAAGARYGAPHWLLLEPRIEAAAVEGDWQLGGAGPAASGSPRAATREDWIRSAVDAAVDALAAAQSYRPGDHVLTQRLRIEGIQSYPTYRAVVEALEGLDMVRGVDVEAMSAGQVTFALRLDGEAELLWRALAGDSRFTAVAGVGDGGDALRLYLWREP